MSAKPKVFFSFHYKDDVNRVQLIRKIGAIDKTELCEPNVWETIKSQGDTVVHAWIDKHMALADCVIVLVGSRTSTKKFVTYEMRKAVELGKPIFGIYIHKVPCMNTGFSAEGKNPFKNVNVIKGGTRTNMADLVPVHRPNADDAYNDIRARLTGWISSAKKV